ncbi:hypothetical protein B0H19DRAFT_1072505 [Mycena capillaripes]|nr:hypothetical protein B0H19DRAFT_1072505 [Mycena capillaripes]
MPGERYHPTMGIELLLARTMEKMVSNIQHQEWWAWGVERRWFCHAVDRGLCDDWGENGKKGEGVLTLSVLICGDKFGGKVSGRSDGMGWEENWWQEGQSLQWQFRPAWASKQAEKEREEIIKCMVKWVGTPEKKILAPSKCLPNGPEKLARTKQLHQEKRKDVVALLQPLTVPKARWV